MGTYKEDSDRLHAMREQRERDVAAAETWERFYAALEAAGVDVEQFVDSLVKVDSQLKRVGIAPDFRRDVVLKAFRLKLGLPEDSTPEMGGLPPAPK